MLASLPATAEWFGVGRLALDGGCRGGAVDIIDAIGAIDAIDGSVKKQSNKECK
jgi:hypothetical protein